MSADLHPLLERELNHIRARAPPYVPPEERLQPTYPTNYPHGVDVAHVAWNHPIAHPETEDTNVYLEQMRSGWSRVSWEDRLAYANRPQRHKPLAMDIASAVGHRNGLVGVRHNQMNEEMDPQWGGGCTHGL